VLLHPLGHGLPSSQLDHGLAELPDDVLRRELLSSWHLSPSFGCDHTRILAPSVASFKGGQVNHYLMPTDEDYERAAAGQPIYPAQNPAQSGAVPSQRT
jgi:hypothetical protein